jgi:hypothetical protein
MELIDVLATKLMIGAGAIDERQSFTANNAVNDLELDAFVPGQGILRSANGLPNLISPKDNIQVLSIGISLPYHYVLSSRIAHVSFHWEDGVGSGAFNIGTGNFIEIPFANYELSIGAYVPWPTPRLNGYQIVMIISTDTVNAAYRMRISQIGGPAALNAAVLPVTSFIKIAHNLPLI